MAHDSDKRREARKKYIFERQTIPVISLALTVPEGTLRRWKREAEVDGDNWDAQKTANMIAGGGLDSVVSDVLQDFIIQFQRAIDDLKADANIPAADRAKVLASLGDSFAKTVSTAGRVAPKISELGVAMDTVKRLSEFIHTRFPQHHSAFQELLGPFGEQLNEIYA